MSTRGAEGLADAPDSPSLGQQLPEQRSRVTESITESSINSTRTSTEDLWSFALRGGDPIPEPRGAGPHSWPSGPALSPLDDEPPAHSDKTVDKTADKTDASAHDLGPLSSLAPEAPEVDRDIRVPRATPHPWSADFDSTFDSWLAPAEPTASAPAVPDLLAPESGSPKHALPKTPEPKTPAPNTPVPEIPEPEIPEPKSAASETPAETGQAAGASGVIDSGPILTRPHPVDVETTAIIEPDTAFIDRLRDHVTDGATEKITETPAEPAPKAGGRRRADRRKPRAKRLARGRGMTVMLVAIAVVALVMGGTALVKTGQFTGASDRTGADDRVTAQPPTSAPAPEVPLLPPPATPRPEPKPEAKKAPAPADATKKPQSGDNGALAMTNCAKRVTDGASLNQAVASASPGQKICAVGNMGGSRLKITRSGTPSAPIQVIGDGSTAVKGITVAASNVVVGGFRAVKPEAPGIEVTGNNITVRDNKVSQPTGGDHDGLRFFGDNIKILNNTISDVSARGTGAHADCMQTFQSDTPASKNVVIQGNRCERVENMCLMAEGPGDKGDGGEGKGVSANWVFSNNYCDTHASQALMIEAVQNVTVRNNQIVGKVDKAFAFDIGSTGAKVSGNKLAPWIEYEVGMDSSSRPGYQGPKIGGAP